MYPIRVAVLTWHWCRLRIRKRFDLFDWVNVLCHLYTIRIRIKRLWIHAVYLYQLPEYAWILWMLIHRLHTHTINRVRTLCQIHCYCVNCTVRVCVCVFGALPPKRVRLQLVCVSHNVSQNSLFTSTPHSLHITLNLFFPSVYLFFVAQKVWQNISCGTIEHTLLVLICNSRVLPVMSESRSRCIKMQKLIQSSMPMCSITLF